MPLVTMKPLLEQAQRDGYAVGAFGVGDIQMVRGALRAAEELRAPLILQIAQVRLSTSPLNLIGPLMLAAAREASVPVAVHLDHGQTLETVWAALELGFTSVMFDGSSMPLTENMETTRRVAELADRYGATVEAEIGTLGKGEDGTDQSFCYSDPQQAKQLWQQTGVDALAVSIGNAHGFYTKEPCLNLPLLEEIHREVPIPLVLHGGTGISPEGFRDCIARGIHKINIATSNYQATADAALRFAQETGKNDYFTLSKCAEQAVFENVRDHLRIFGSEQKV